MLTMHHQLEVVDTSLSPRLPQEIAEKIIDCTTHGTSLRHLKALSLVCCAWLPRARYHLFRRLRVFISQVNPDALEDLLVRLQESAAGRKAEKAKFLPAVDFVQELLVSDPFRSNASVSANAGLEAQDRTRSTPEPLGMLERVLSTLPHLRVLELDLRVRYCPLSDRPRSAPHAGLFTHLQRLVLSADVSPCAVLPLFVSVGALRFTVPMNFVSLDDGPLEMGSGPVHHLVWAEWHHGDVQDPGQPAGVAQTRAKVRVGRAIFPARVLSTEYARALRELGAVAAIQHLTVEGGQRAGTSTNVDDARKKVLDAFACTMRLESLTMESLT